MAAGGTRGGGQPTLAHVPDYVARHHAAPAAKIERHRTKEMVTEPLAEETRGSASAFAVKNVKGGTKAAQFWCSPGGRWSNASGEARGRRRPRFPRRLDFLKPAVPRFSPLHQGQAAGPGGGAARKKGTSRMATRPTPLPERRGRGTS